jgi:hypothetical protein
MLLDSAECLVFVRRRIDAAVAVSRTAGGKMIAYSRSLFGYSFGRPSSADQTGRPGMTSVTSSSELVLHRRYVKGWL